MGHAFHQLYYHYVWTTKDRIDCLVGETHRWLLRGLDEEAHRRGGVVLAYNAMADHAHLLVSLPPTICVATYIGQVKGALAFEFNKQHTGSARIAWQEGYGVVSLRAGESQRVAEYVNNQQAIHASRKIKTLLERTESDET
jgi:putative transposase